MSSSWSDSSDLSLSDFPSSLEGGMEIFDKLEPNLDFCGDSTYTEDFFKFTKNDKLFPDESNMLINLDGIKKEHDFESSLFDFPIDDLDRDPLGFGMDVDLLNSDSILNNNFMDFDNLSAAENGLEMKDCLGVADGFIKPEPGLLDDKDEFGLDSLLKPTGLSHGCVDFPMDDMKIKEEPDFSSINLKMEPDFDTCTLSDSYLTSQVSKDASRKLLLGNVESAKLNAINGVAKPIRRVVVCSDKSRNIVCNVVKAVDKTKTTMHPSGTRTLVIPAHPGPPKQIRVNVVSGDCSRLIPVRKYRIDAKALQSYIDHKRPETPQGSDDESSQMTKKLALNLNSSRPLKKSNTFGKSYRTYMAGDEDYLTNDSYKCLPPAEVTGQVQPLASMLRPSTSPSPIGGKLTPPNSSPLSSQAGHTNLESFYDKTMELMFNKNAASIDHDYGFSCRSQLSQSFSFSPENLGIQTPSASEPPTDDDDEDSTSGVEVDDYGKSFKYRKLESVKSRKSAGIGGCFPPSANGIVSVEKKKNCGRKRKISYELMDEDEDAWLAGARVKVSLCNGNDISTTTASLRLKLAEATAAAKSSKKQRSSGEFTGCSRKSGSRVFTPTERYLHNTNEQVRRVEMRQSFEDLKNLVPNLSAKPKAAKVTILQEAKLYCEELYYKDLKLQTQVSSLKQHQHRLRTYLSQLRKNAALART